MQMQVFKNQCVKLFSTQMNGMSFLLIKTEFELCIPIYIIKKLDILCKERMCVVQNTNLLE